MGLERIKPVIPVGSAHGLAHFVTASWSDLKVDGKVVEYEIVLDTNEWTMYCQCKDSVCRKKNYLPLGDEGLCKHSAWVAKNYWPIIARSLRLSH